MNDERFFRLKKWSGKSIPIFAGERPFNPFAKKVISIVIVDRKWFVQQYPATNITQRNLLLFAPGLFYILEQKRSAYTR